MKKSITDRTVKSLKPQAQSYECMDTMLAGFGVRVAPTGGKSYIFLKRYPGSKNPARRTLGSTGELTLAEAREKARSWLAMMERGIDPAIEEARLKAAAIEAERAKKVASVAAALDVYSRRKLSKLRTGRVIEAELRRQLSGLMNKPIPDVTPNDVKAVIMAIVDSGHEAQAHQTFAMVRAFFNWAVDTGDYGIETSPCVRLKPKVLIGSRAIGDRVLKDHELRAYWNAAEGLGYPGGHFLRFLAMTAVRRGEAADASWSEIDLDAKLWTIPAERMKAGAAHSVPLTADAIALLQSIPRYKHGGDFIFSSSGGRKPISGFGYLKDTLDAAMRADLEAQGFTFEPFTIHDIRRTCRTRFSTLSDKDGPVQDIVRELLLAHTKPGLHKVYDLHSYDDEKRRALELWSAKLRSIVTPPPANVVPLRAVS